MASSTRTTQQRHFCIVLTNNPRMIKSAQQLLSSITHGATSEESSQAQRQQQQQLQQQSLPLSPLHSQFEGPLQHIDSPIQTRSQSRLFAQQRIEQQVPMTMPHAAAIEVAASNTRAYEKEIEAEFQVQIQPILQLYLERTRRSTPINSIFDMSSRVEL